MNIIPKVKIWFPIWKLFISKLIKTLISWRFIKSLFGKDKLTLRALFSCQPMVSNVNFPNFATEIHFAIKYKFHCKYKFHFLSGRAGKYWYDFLLDVEKHHTCIPVCLRSKEFDAGLSNPRNLPLKFRATDWYYQSYSLSDNV